MPLADKHDPLDGIDDVPWHRLVHFRGRASDIPSAIRALGGPTRDDARRHLLRCLEHQDAVTQATPFAVRFILRMRQKDPDGVRTIIAPIAAAAKFMMKKYPGPVPDVSWEASLSEPRLWPAFTSQLDDEARWEEWEPSPDEWVAWPLLTLREIERSACTDS